MTPDLYVWKSPRDVDAAQAEGLVTTWQSAGGDPSASPFEPSTDVGWFYRELLKDLPGLETSSDAVPSTSSAPIWLAATDEPPARVVAIRLPAGTAREALDLIVSLAAKYDLVLYDAANRRVHLPLEVMAAYASATFWPAGAIQAAIAGGVGAVIALAAWLVGIPVLSPVLMLVGVFMLVMAIYTFVHAGRNALKRREPTRPPE